MDHFEIEILSPTGKVYTGLCASANLPGAAGRFEILSRHSNLVSQLDAGLMNLVLPNGERIDYKITEGVAEVSKGHCIILIDDAEMVSKE